MVDVMKCGNLESLIELMAEMKAPVSSLHQLGLGGKLLCSSSRHFKFQAAARGRCPHKRHCTIAKSALTAAA